MPVGATKSVGNFAEVEPTKGPTELTHLLVLVSFVVLSTKSYIFFGNIQDVLSSNSYLLIKQLIKLSCQDLQSTPWRTNDSEPIVRLTISYVNHLKDNIPMDMVSVSDFVNPFILAHTTYKVKLS